MRRTTNAVCIQGEAEQLADPGGASAMKLLKEAGIAPKFVEHLIHGA
jgi:hypothetical protein